jgi:hypothetical protein
MIAPPDHRQVDTGGASIRVRMGESFKSNEISNHPKQWWGLVNIFGVRFLEVWRGDRLCWDAFWGPFAPRLLQEANP